MDTADLIWKNGEFVRLGGRQDARAQPRPALRHRRLRGDPLLRDRARAGDLPPPRPPRAAQKSAGLYYLDLPYQRRELRLATHELLRRNGLSSAYIRPLAFRGYGEMGLYAKTAPIDVIVAAWGWGSYLGDESKPTASAPRSPAGGRSPAQPDPARQGLRPVPELDPGQNRVGQLRLRRGDPARRTRLRLRGLGREHLRPPRRQIPDAGRTSPRSSTGSTATR